MKNSLLIVLGLGALALFLFSCTQNRAVVKLTEEDKQALEDQIVRITEGFDKTESGLFYKIIEKGSGIKAEKGQNVSVHYEGSLLSGKVFDSSYKRKEPIDFPLGVGRVIAGWDEGIALLQEGGKARLVIPPNLGYGARGAGRVIPPNATLIFDVELVAVK